MQIQKVNRQSIQRAVKLLKAGKAVAYPTDTTYGLAVDATNHKAVKRLYLIKSRDFKKPVHVVTNSLAMAKKFTIVDSNSSMLAEKFFPGPLTLVLKLKTFNLKHKNWKLLSAGTGKIGIRIPKNKISLGLVKKFKRPITATSSNVSGQPDCYSSSDIIKQFKNKKHQPDLILDGGKLQKVKPSTIIDFTKNKPELIRGGPISFKKILGALR